MNKNWLLTLTIVLVLCLYFGLRFWNFEDKFSFRFDQGIHLSETKQMVDSKKIRLVGPEVTSKTYMSRGFFIGPQYYYLLAILGVLAGWEPFKITIAMALIEFLILVVFCIWISDRWGIWTAVIIGFTLAISPYLIIHTNFFWNPHIMLWLTMLVPILLDKWQNSKNIVWLLVLGIIWGVAFGFHYSAVFWFIPVVYVFTKSADWKWLTVPIGFILGDLPYFIFELRHNFYNLQTFFYSITQSSSGNKLEPHYIINPLLSFGLVLIIYFIFRIKGKTAKAIVVVLFILIGYWVQTLIYPVGKTPLDQPEKWNFQAQNLVVNNILKNGCPENYNVASTITGDTRAYDLRYLLILKNCPPMGVSEYPKAKTIFYISRPNRSPANEGVWEISKLKNNIVLEVSINEKINLYELSKSAQNLDKKVVTIVNPVRSRELWKDKSLSPIKTQYGAINKFNLSATWLIQDDVFFDKELVDKIKSFNEKQELGIFLEVSKDLAYRSRIYFDEQRPWYDPGVVFLSAYDIGDRKKIIDTMMSNFKNVFGYYPKSVGAWWIDSWSQQYLENKYDIKTFLICADQKTTDKYGIWGQWWGYPYIPSPDNILVPGNSKSVVIQWAQRDLEKAYFGSGFEVSNYSLQANDYLSQKLDIKYFEKLASQYLGVEKLGQITVGLETGIESVGNEVEFEKQLKWLADNKITSLKMGEFGDKYREIYSNKNPEKVILGDWVLTPDDRSNPKLGEKTVYQKNMVFADLYQKDTSEFLDRVYAPENLVKKKLINVEMLIKMICIILGFAMAFKFKKIKWWMIFGVGIVVWMLIHVRYSIVNGEKMIGFLVDNFRFVGVNIEKGLVNSDLTNNVAKSMLRLRVDQLYFIYYCAFGLMLGKIYEKLKQK